MELLRRKFIKGFSFVRSLLVRKQRSINPEVLIARKESCQDNSYVDDDVIYFQQQNIFEEILGQILTHFLGPFSIPLLNILYGGRDGGIIAARPEKFLLQSVENSRT